MNILNDLPTTPLVTDLIGLSIGNFDGVHLGHQAVLNTLKDYSRSHKGTSAVITFTNHPTEVLKPDIKVLQICTYEHKVKLIKQSGIETLILLKFTKELSQHTAEEFVRKTRKSLPFSYLILGHDATLGKDRQGDRKRMEEVAKLLQFDVCYLPEQTLNGERISSTKIRQLIQEGNLMHASKLLGREYSVYSKVVSGKKVGGQIGFPTANISVEGLCLPPLGVYAVHVLINEKAYLGVANLGYAPTVRHDSFPTLEVFLFDTSVSLYNDNIEVIFSSYLRPESKFESIEALKAQIQIDIMNAKKALEKESIIQ
jgi:riboflavin kinase / FMN adenylyltransferase